MTNALLPVWRVAQRFEQRLHATHVTASKKGYERPETPRASSSFANSFELISRIELFWESWNCDTMSQPGLLDGQGSLSEEAPRYAPATKVPES
ncbi:MAG TPA: hypothetical protein PKN33_18740 [Phycisphaerae bacterium]|nr:hypothetical protein [Phycisphaerae bacterium]